MFTGIIEEVGKLTRIDSSGDLHRLSINCRIIPEDLILGASICCNGVCLTVTSFDQNSITTEVMPETFRKTTVSSWHVGSLINMERALKPNSRLDGHIVQGHVDGVTSISKVEARNKTAKITLALPAEGYNLVAEQGSIALNGVSLTISSLAEKHFSVSLVDFTLQQTNLGKLRAGDKVNIEYDIIGKYISRIKKSEGSKLSEKKLYDLGY